MLGVMTGERRRTIRMSDGLWTALSEKAAREGSSASDVLRKAAFEYVGAPLTGGPMSPHVIALTVAVMAAGASGEVLDRAVAKCRTMPVPSSPAALEAQVRSVLKSIETGAD